MGQLAEGEEPGSNLLHSYQRGNDNSLGWQFFQEWIFRAMDVIYGNHLFWTFETIFFALQSPRPNGTNTAHTNTCVVVFVLLITQKSQGVDLKAITAR